MEEQEAINESTITSYSSSKKNLWMIATIFLGIVVVILLVLNFSGGITGHVISGKEAGEKLLNIYTSRGTTGLTIDSIEEESGVYKINFAYQGSIIPVYMTKDGKLAGSLSLVPDSSSTTQTQNQETQEIPKSDKPKAELYVMSFCPYGNRAEDTMLPVYNLLKNKVDFNVHYIVSVSGDAVQSLHGQPEVDENIRESCVLTNNGLDKWWAFINYVNDNCGSDGSCWKQAAQQAGVSEASISSCVSTKGLSLMKEEADASDAAGVSGSPTLIINGVETTSVYQYGNSEAYKQAICSAFTTAPEECEETLSSSTTTTGGSC